MAEPATAPRTKRRRKRRSPAPGFPLPQAPRVPAPRAWLVSGGLHALALLIALGLWGAAPPMAAPSEPIELVDVLIDGPVGDQGSAQDRPTPKARVHRIAPLDAQDAQADSEETVDAPKRLHAASRPTQADTPPRPDLEDLLARREARDRQREAKRVGQLASAADQPLSSDPGNDRKSSATDRGGSVDTGAGLTGDLGQRRILQQVQPAYPDSAKRAGTEGEVRLRVTVTPEGRVGQVEVVRLSGTPEMDRRAVEALKRWRFAPLPEGSPAVNQWGTITLRYRLD